jgi:uncharacterized protein YukE
MDSLSLGGKVMTYRRKGYLSVVITMVIALIVCTLVTASGCGTLLKGGAASTPTSTPTSIPTTSNSISNPTLVSGQVSAVEFAALSSTVNTLSGKIATLPSSVATLQSSVTSLQSSVATLTSANKSLTTTVAANDVTIKGLTANVSNLQSNVSSLKSNVDQLQQLVGGQSVVIGVNPTNINGLSVTFPIPSGYIYGRAEATTPSYAQLAIKITNNNSYSIVNVDITGVVTFSTNLYYISPGYPTMVDANTGGPNYIANATGGSSINYEVYSTAKIPVAISIPAGGSLTLRPRIGLLKDAAYATISISTISYDKGK